MSKEKQIEEMADDLMACHIEFTTGVGDIYTDYDETASKMFAKGYRKQSEGEWIYKENEEAFFCSLCDQEALIDANTIGIGFAIAELSDYCPHCGAKMKGGAE